MPLLSNLHDDFVGSNGTALTAHTADSGDTWVTGTGMGLNGSGFVKTTNTSSDRGKSSESTPGSNPYVEISFTRPNTAAGIWEAGFGTREVGAVFQEGFHLAVVRFTTAAGVIVRTYEGDMAGSPTTTDVATIEAGPLTVGGVTSIPMPCVMHWEGTTLTVNGIDYTLPFALRSGEPYVLSMLSNSGGDPMLVDYIDAGEVAATSHAAASTEPLSFGQPAVVAATVSMEPLSFGQPTVALTAARARAGVKPVSFGKPVGPNNARRSVKKGMTPLRWGPATAFPPA